jgi:upstream stimulatory factor
MDHDEHITPKELIESDDEDEKMNITIVEEDGTTSIVEDASVSSIITTDSEPHSSLQFAQSQGGGVTYRVVGIANDGTAYTQPTSGVQVISPSLNGQYYVIGSQDVMGRQINSRSAQIIDTRSLVRASAKVAVRDEKKRATHNEVERRRRDKINGWINKLAKIVPACNEDNFKQGHVHQNSSKGGILAKACEYINELRTTNCRLASTLKEHENTAEELAALKRQVSELRRENMMLKQQIGPTEEDSTIIVSTSE